MDKQVVGLFQVSFSFECNQIICFAFRCSFDVHLENVLSCSSIAKPDLLPRSNIELPESYWNNKLSPEEIFKELGVQTFSNSLVHSNFDSRIGENYHQVIQKYLILDNLDLLVDHVYEWTKGIQNSREKYFKSSPESKSDDEQEWFNIVEPNLLRFFAHLMIVLRSLDLINASQFDLYFEILEVYIGFLIEYTFVELVAFYSRYLPEHKQVKIFATLLSKVEDQHHRQYSIVVAKEAQLNVSAILTLVVENIRHGNYGYQSNDLDSAQGESKLTATTTNEDLKKISALDWFLLSNTDGVYEESAKYAELLWQVNALIRDFLVQQKVELATSAFVKMPVDIVEQAFAEYKENPESILFDFDNVVREYLSHKTYFEANEAFQKWYVLLKFFL